MNKGLEQKSIGLLRKADEKVKIFIKKCYASNDIANELDKFKKDFSRFILDSIEEIKDTQ